MYFFTCVQNGRAYSPLSSITDRIQEPTGVHERDARAAMVFSCQINSGCERSVSIGHLRRAYSRQARSTDRQVRTCK